MSETLKNSIPLTEVVSPLLNDVEYASKLEGVFQNINDNFIQLANRDFVKGESGASVEIKEVDLIKDGQLTMYGERLKASIESLSSNQQDITYKIDDVEYTLNIFDNLYANPGKLQMIYNTANDNETPIAVSSLYYVFLDGRFANNVIGKLDDSVYSQYTNIKDMSCILVYDNSIGGFKVLENAFPTIYYEKGVGLCWEINGNPTGIPVRGIPGKDGANATLHIVKCNSIETDNMIIRGEVAGIYGMHDGYTELDEDIAQYNGQAALILVTQVDKGFYFGYLRVEDDKLYAYCDQETAINYGIETEAIINAMKKINLLNKGEDASSGSKGLFVPMQAEKDGVQPVHLLSSTSITNTEGQTSDLKTDFVFTPINDINALDVGDNNLQVDKYLYLRINENSFGELFTTENADKISEADCKLYNYLIKYKLTNVVNNINDTWFDVLSNDKDGNIYGSRYFGVDKYNESKVNLSDDNVVYYNGYAKNGLSSAELTNDHKLSIPIEFGERLAGWDYTKNPIGIYRWEICNIVDVFDNSIKDLSGLNAERYNFPTAFGVVYTTTVNPSSSSDFMWFNGMHIATSADFEINDPRNNNGYIDDASDEYAGKYVILGWSTGDRDSTLEFVKFVPIYNNDFAVNEDTALNINYNVNITGDVNNPNRSITVHGAVNCDDLSVYRLTATDEIKNIFTRNDIIGEGGIKLGKKDDEYAAVIGADGLITCKSIDTPKINTETLVASTEISSPEIKSSQLRVDTNNRRQLFIGTPEESGYEFTVELRDTECIDVSRKISADQLGNTMAQPAISSDTPIIQHNNANIIVSNQAKGSEHLCYYGVNADVENRAAPSSPYKGGTGVTGTISGTTRYISKPDFDYVKNFNMHRLAVEAKAGTQKKKTTNCNQHKQINIDTLNLVNYNRGYSKNVGFAQEENVTEAKCIEILTLKGAKNEAPEGATLKFDRTQPIRIEFSNDCDYLTYIGIRGENSNGRWPFLNANSYMDLFLYYSIDGTMNATPIASKHYTFDFSTSSPKDDSGYEWRGYDKAGNYLGGNGGDAWRYYPYAFRPSAFVINNVKNGIFNTGEHTTYRAIADAYDNGQEVKFYIFPKYYIEASSQDNAVGSQKKVTAGVQAYSFVPVKKTGKVTAGSSVLKNLCINSKKQNETPEFAKQWTPSIVNDACTVNYVVNETPNGDSTAKSTTICNDGIVIRSGDAVFGIGCAAAAYDHENCGYDTLASIKGTTGVTDPTWSPKNSVTPEYLSNEPVLFYHIADSNYYDNKHEPKTGDKTLEGYALRTHSIPLKDIFEVIKFMRNTSTAKYGV